MIYHVEGQEVLAISPSKIHSEFQKSKLSVLRGLWHTDKSPDKEEGGRKSKRYLVYKSLFYLQQYWLNSSDFYFLSSFSTTTITHDKSFTFVARIQEKRTIGFIMMPKWKEICFKPPPVQRNMIVVQINSHLMDHLISELRKLLHFDW